MQLKHQYKNLFFYKMHGLGNDFIIIDIQDLQTLSLLEITALCNRNTGIGCDQLLGINLDNIGNQINIKIFNSDGSIALNCGNGLRAIALLYNHLYQYTEIKLHLIDINRTFIATVLEPNSYNITKLISVEMPTPTVQKIYDSPYEAYHVNVGNEHLIIKTNYLMVEPKMLENLYTIYGYTSTDINLSLVIERDSDVMVRIWEKGAGETYACGTAATAVFSIFKKNKISFYHGGELNFQQNNNAIFMIGPATIVGKGEVFVH